MYKNVRTNTHAVARIKKKQVPNDSKNVHNMIGNTCTQI